MKSSGSKWPLALRCILLMSVISAPSGAEKAQPVPGPTDPGNLPKRPGLEHYCALAAPDAEFFIPQSFSRKSVPSASGFYGYRPFNKCPYWIVDFSMNSKANTFVHPDTNTLLKEKTVFAGEAYNLPSSAYLNGTVPIVEEDCKRLYGDYYVYRKMKHEPTFNFVKKVEWKGVWSTKNKSCGVTIPRTGDYYAPTANVLVVRIAVRVVLRSSFQEATAIAQDGPLD